MFQTILAQFRKLLPPTTLNSIARQSGLIKRKTSKIDGTDICLLLLRAVNWPSELSLSCFCKLLYETNNSAKLKPQSLWERIVNPKAVRFITEIYSKTWNIYIKKITEECSKHSIDFFESFTQVLIEDSTIITLNEKLSSYFKGLGGKGCKSSLKIHLIYDALLFKFCWIKIYRDRCADGALVHDIIPQISHGGLIIRDLGFFAVNAFKQIMAKNAFFISRLKIDVNVYLARNGKAINLVKFIKSKYKYCSMGSLEVLVGAEEKVPMRLVFYKTPEDIVNKRKQKLKRTCGKKGRNPSEKLLIWQEYTILITNLEENIAPDRLIGTVYRLRWDIELVFKVWKSQLRLDVLKGTRSERVEVFLFTKLIGILLLGMVCNHIRNCCSRLGLAMEISEAKVAKFLIEMDVFLSIFRGYINKVKIEFLTNEYWIQSFFKQKRKRKTTRQRIATNEIFGGLAF